MKVIIAGSRSIRNPRWVERAVKDSRLKITEVVSGTAKGVDRFGEAWAEANGIPVTRFPADWASHGRAAGPIRNAAMANYADALIAIWDGTSRGTRHMIDTALEKGLTVYVVKLEPHSFIPCRHLHSKH